MMYMISIRNQKLRKLAATLGSAYLKFLHNIYEFPEGAHLFFPGIAVCSLNLERHDQLDFFLNHLRELFF